MAEESSGASVGSISLDLVISAPIQKQLERIRSAAEKPAERVGEAIEEAISKPMEETGKNVEKTLSETVGKVAQAVESKLTNAFDSARKEAEQSTGDIEAALERLRQREYKTPEYSDTPETKAETSGSYIQYDSDEIMRQIEEPMNKTVENIKEKLGAYEVPTDPVERLRQEIDNSYFKLDLLQKKWQELSAADPTDKVCSQLQSVQQQIISTTSSIDKMEEKLAKASGADKLSQLSSNYESRIRSIEEQNAAKIEQITARTTEMKERYEQQIAALKEQNAAKIQEIESQSAAKINALHQKSASNIQAGQAKIRSSVGKTSNAFTKLGKSIKNAAKSVFIMAGIYGLFRGIKSAVESAMSGNEEFSKSLNQVKANLNIAFTPIIQSVMPMLNTLMSGLASVTKSVAGFISGLFGTTYKQAAEATKKLKSVTDSAKKAKMSTAGIDEMNILSDDEESSSDDSEGIDYSALGDGDKKAEELGAKVKEYLSKAFETVGIKAKATFQQLKKWATVSFAPTFAGIWDGLKAETDELKVTLGGVFSDICSLGEPLKEYFSGDFTTYLQSVFSNIGLIVLGLYDTFNMIFSDIWNIAIFPILSSFITLGLPVITQFSTEVNNTIGVLFTEIKEIFDMLWEDVVDPILGFIAEVWEDLMQSIKKFWDKWGQPIFDKFREAIELTGDYLKNLWENIYRPIFDKLMSVLDDIWKEHLRPLVDNFLDFVGELVDGALEIYNKFIMPVVNWFVKEFGPPITAIWDWILDTVGNVVKGIIDEVNGIITILKGVVQFVTGVFTGDWDKAWQGIKNIFQGVWETFEGIAKTPINLIIDLVNGLTGAIETGLNWIIDKINTLSFDVPDWVPEIGGSTLGFNFDHVDIPEIPHLATGGLATAPTLAMVGDNKNARTDPEVIAPLSKLSSMMGNNTEVVELLKVIVELLKSGMSIEIINYLFKGSREFSREVVKAVNMEKALSGGGL